MSFGEQLFEATRSFNVSVEIDNETITPVSRNLNRPKSPSDFQLRKLFQVTDNKSQTNLNG